jgi:hypothetical protein
VDKPWVREELNASVVQKITNKTKIIPVVIDECEIPAALKSTVWERIKNREHFQDELDHIVSAIFENRARPPLGAPPAYLNQPIALRQLTHRHRKSHTANIGKHTEPRGDCAPSLQ